ncbi:1-(5-phosphoribosyl)-5-[(5-phosphoribosylamino)methylideneamino]imidazole-4-carboxamide isomerase [Tenacibaculum ovolyticum]|uniref:1-(5-phosphoribosyl)-5-[(5- phosphoribosylamino)methylideneamino]imidazole-4- carboxamide isomerase n=1 Tax=Tenacibaculum ovolyticum TaxID=104270 RepID=UPI0007ED1B42|nr:1-(5-phosphoribosyl)-5-[(5-phosphoribosylamino)methylideneamino]imidazole-4-carboxamide isomerase [Tenacibaculum ovolyticum]WBX75568.1 1-(5-phosphoribosyl)-5-[(5-phosphoribosylamino)methylideneamino]imidazole-4-carboxamide isomerase [Tenacibaculum ovolyticum]
MRIIPAIDIIEGKCVRLTKGDYATKKIYNENPVEVAKEFEDNGVEYLHLVDLDGAKSQHIVNYKILEQIAAKTNLKIDFGGGLKSDDDLRIAFDNGANQITGGSIAVKNPEVFTGWFAMYGADKIILGADCINRKIATHGWLETSEIDVIDFIKQYEKIGLKNTICTDVAKDGMLQGASVDLYQEILSKSAINLIASGGVSKIEDLFRLKEIGCEGAILGKAIYENRISLKQLQNFIIN